ncbi:restriction endonuclease subunit S [Phenylobacterium sp. NIBR 498073]|uniref:restriction endonuclease subunit S n=1 Tax=Phenylobacterium sp. NIBR 498073 TaxID=3015177 RepID=UPI0022B2BF38|nr:restriction endonuclease subunit S [Phenylobacterium sp. NIBR 498073]WGU40938.1 restriction endonuclease subunit S [Phenylobacterium sp. NIBR 498073]
MLSRPLGEIASFVNGDRSSNYPSGTDFVPVGVPFVSAADLENGAVDWASTRKISEAAFDRLRSGKTLIGDLLFCLRGSLGKVARVQGRDRAAIASSLVIVRAKEAVLQDYLFYVLSGPVGQRAAEILNNGSVQGNISVRDLQRTPVPLPSLAEQKAIVEVLGALEDRIELNQRMNKTLEKIAQAIFRDWFVEFGPVRRKLAGVSDATKILGGLVPGENRAAELAQLFPSKFSPDGAPENWSRAFLGDYFALERGLSYKGEFLADEGNPMINLGCFLGRGRFSNESLKRYVGEYRPRHTVSIGDLVIANTDMTQDRVILGSPHIVEDCPDTQPLLFSHHVYAARPRSPGAEAWVQFFFYHLLQPAFRERAEGFATGTTVLALPKDAIERFEFVMPSEPLYLEFREIVGPLRARHAANQRECVTLAEARDYLIPRLMSGEVKVRDVARGLAA